MEADVHYFVLSYPIAGGEGTGTPQQELSVDLDELALAQVKADFPWMHAMVHGNSLAQVDAESDAQAGRY